MLADPTGLSDVRSTSSLRPLCVNSDGGGGGGWEEGRGAVTLDSEPSAARRLGEEGRGGVGKLREISPDTAACVLSVLRSSKSLLRALFFFRTATVKPLQPPLGCPFLPEADLEVS